MPFVTFPKGTNGELAIPRDFDMDNLLMPSLIAEIVTTLNVRRFISWIPFAILTCVLGGCAVANRAIQTDFTAFNTTIQYNQSQQMLLNIVRLHFRESVEFLQAASLSASYESTAGGDAGIQNLNLSNLNGWPGVRPSPATGTADINYKFSSKPTITYSPVDGKNYVQQFLSKVTPNTCSLLIDAGWPIKKIGNLLVDRVYIQNGDCLVNRASSPSYPKFKAWLNQLDQAWQNDQLEIRPAGDSFVIHRPDGDFPVNALHFRSLLDVMFFAARNVVTPASQRKFVKEGDSDGEITIHSSRFPPTDVLVSVWYKGHFYSIRNDDVKSKDTFALLMQLYRLQAAPVGGTPVLTIPVR
jgi:hypothetical protein